MELTEQPMELTEQPMELPHYIYGIAFSGAQDAGKKIWIAEGIVKTDSLLIEDCFRARDLQDSGNELDICLPALKAMRKKGRQLQVVRPRKIRKAR